MDVDHINKLVERLEQAVSKIESFANNLDSQRNNNRLEPFSATSTPCPMPTAPFVVEFEKQVLQGPLSTASELSKKIGGDVKDQFVLVDSAFQEQLKFLKVVGSHTKPSDQELQKLLKPTADKISEIIAFGESHRGSQFMNHLFAVKESIGALGWVTMNPAPGPFVREMHDAAQFYTNRVLKDFKDKDANHVDFVKSFLGIWISLQAYIKTFHTTGVSWSKSGSPATASDLGGSVTSAPCLPPGGCIPPPPPPVQLHDFPYVENEEAARCALFAALNTGEGVTKGLKKVTPDQQTHKNPALKQQKPAISPKPGSKGTPPPTGVAKTTTATTKPPKLELEGNKWAVENHVGNKNIIISDTELKQTVYIYKCQDCVIQVKGKLNSITLDSCKKTGLIFDDIISSVDVVNCQSVQIQVIYKVPTVGIDKTDGCQVYLSKDSLSTEIISAKSSEMNIVIPKDNGDVVEFSIPEQFKTRYDGKKLKTECNESLG